jgi:hypothetical protein
MTTKRSPFRITVILVVVLVGLVVLPVGCMVQSWHRSKQRLVHMLCETDYQAVLKGCRELSQRVATPGETKHYHLRSPLPWPLRVRPSPEAASLPKAILDADLAFVEVDPDGLVRVLLWTFSDEGLVAYPENYPGYPNFHPYGTVELIPGLWFLDRNYKPGSRSKSARHFDQLIQRGKDYQRSLWGKEKPGPSVDH